jgi:hypothetical protein
MHRFSTKPESIHIPYAGLAAIMLTLGLLVIAAPANAQSEPASGPPQENLAALGKKLTDPLSDVWALFTEFDATWSEGDFSNGDHRTGSRMLFQPILPIPLTENWKVLARPIVPIMFSQDVPTGRRYDSSESTDGTTVILKPDGSATFDSKDGMGDIKLPLLFSPVQKPGALGWGWGAGPTFQFPTATDDSLGTDTWEAGPAAVLTYKRKGFMAAAFGQYWWNFAETNSRATDTSHGSLLYVAYWDLPRTWQIGFSPTITYNNKATSGNKWNVPIGVTIAKMHKFGKLPVKFQLAIEKSIVREDDFGVDWNLRLNIIPVIPGLVKSPLF